MADRWFCSSRLQEDIRKSLMLLYLNLIDVNLKNVGHVHIAHKCSICSFSFNFENKGFLTYLIN